MKTILYAVIIILGTFTISAQNFDIVLKNNGEEMEGNVKAIDDNSIQFVYKNESIEYKVKQSDVVKITFASGRIQFLNKPTAGDNKPKTSLGDHHNKVAVLPFAYIKDESNGSKAISDRIQVETFSLFNKHKGALQYQDIQTTNALLIKAGVTNNNIQGYTMGEIANILGVEYIIQGTVSVQKTTQNVYNSSSSTTKKDGAAYVDRNGHLVGDININGKKQTSTFGSSTAIQNYSTSMIINIYNDKGNSIFTQDHTAFWNTQDAYKITLKYIAKRTPLYKK